MTTTRGSKRGASASPTLLSPAPSFNPLSAPPSSNPTSTPDTILGTDPVVVQKGKEAFEIIERTMKLKTGPPPMNVHELLDIAREDTKWRVDGALDGMIQDLQHFNEVATRSKLDSGVESLLSADIEAIMDMRKAWKDQINALTDNVRKRLDQYGVLYSSLLHRSFPSSRLPEIIEVEEEEASVTPAPPVSKGMITRAKSGVTNKRKLENDLVEEQGNAAQAVLPPRKKAKSHGPAEPTSKASSLAKPVGRQTRASQRNASSKPTMNVPQGAMVGGPPIETATTISETNPVLGNSLPAASKDTLKADPSGSADTLSVPDNSTAVHQPQEKGASNSKSTARTRKVGPACEKCRRGKVKCVCTPEQIAANSSKTAKGDVVKKRAPPAGSKPLGVEKKKPKAKPAAKAKGKA